MRTLKRGSSFLLLIALASTIFLIVLRGEGRDVGTEAQDSKLFEKSLFATIQEMENRSSRPAGMADSNSYSISGRVILQETAEGLSDVIISLTGSGPGPTIDAPTCTGPTCDGGPTCAVTCAGTTCAVTCDPTCAGTTCTATCFPCSTVDTFTCSGFTCTYCPTVSDYTCGYCPMFGEGSPKPASSNIASTTTTTDANGYYAFTNLPNGSYIITPGKTGYTFTPASRTVTITDSDVSEQDFEAIEEFIITTVAGTGTAGFSGDGGPATEAKLNRPRNPFLDSEGNLLVADALNNRIRQVDGQTGIITTVVGTGEAGFSGDGGPATEAKISWPLGVFLDAGGNMFIADTENYRIRRVDGQTGIITTVAGTGEAGFSGDGGPATEAKFGWLNHVFVGPGGDLFITDQLNSRVRRVDGQTGIITTVAGTGEKGSSGDGGPATEAELNAPGNFFVNSAGDLFISENYGYCVRRVDGQTGIITTVAGTGEKGSSGDGGPATEAELDIPASVFVDSDGDLFISEWSGHRIRCVNGIAAPTILEIGIFAPNLIPPVADANGPYTGNEGSPITFDGTGSSDSDGAIQAYEWDWDNDGTFDAAGETAQMTWADDHTGTVALRVTDNDGLTHTDTATVTVSNVAPAIQAVADQTANVDDTVNVSANFTDPGTSDTHTATINWGDEHVDTIDPATSPVIGSHAYADSGVYTVTVTVTDDDGGIGTETFIVSVGTQVSVKQSWNLISFPLEPLDPEPSAVLASIEGKYNSIWAYEPETGWSMYAPGAPGDLDELVAGKGYWLEMYESETLILAGTVPDSTDIFLKGGKWTLAGYSSLSPRTPESCMSGVADKINSVWEYSPDTGWSVYVPGGVGNLDLMKPGYGYWIKANADCNWNVNESLP